MINTLSDLAIEHDYYCSESNYYSNEPYMKFDTFKDFIEEFGDANVDTNLVFRWDIEEETDDDTSNPLGFYRMKIFQIKQRKGIFACYDIRYISDEDIPSILEYLKPHKEKLDNIWKPL